MKKKRFCLIPFSTLYINQDNLAPCCLGFLKEPMFLQDNVSPLNANLKEAWNCDQMVDLRQSIIDGNYKYCSEENCPSLSNYHSLPTLEGIEKLTLIEKKNIINSIKNNTPKLDYPPEKLMLNYDESCNLACPSCRNDFIINKSNELKQVHLNINQQLDFTHGVYMSGLGDPLVSVGHRKWLTEFRAKNHPTIESIYLHTNGQLFDEKFWNSLHKDCQSRIKSIEISIDAATKATYSIVRKGGDFNRLVENLEFIKKLREQEGLEIYVSLIFIVSSENYHEILDIIKLNDHFKFNLLTFYAIKNWQHIPADTFDKLNICSRNHPDFNKLVEIVKNKRFHPFFFNKYIHSYNIIGNFDEADRFKGQNFKNSEKYYYFFVRVINHLKYRFRQVKRFLGIGPKLLK